MTSSRNVSFAAVAPVNISILTGMESRLAVMTVSEGRQRMNRQDYLQKNFELSMDLRETERQIAGLYNRKKQILAEMDAIQEQMVEDARNGKFEGE